MQADGRPLVSVDRLRELVGKEVGCGGARLLAARLEMTEQEVAAFAAGAEPDADDLFHMRSWYYQNHPSVPVPQEFVADGLEWLLSSLREPERTQLALSICDKTEGMHQKQGTRVPGWIDIVRKRLGAHP